MSNRIYILGGGPAGMAAAYYAHRNKIPFYLYESSQEVGGNCKTIAVNEFKFDTGAHRFHDKNEEVTRVIKELVGDSLQKVSAPSKIFWNNKFIDFPIRISDIFLKVGFKNNLKIAGENIFKQFQPRLDNESFKALAYSSYGKTLAELFLINYTEKLWGEKTNKLSSEIAGGRLKHLDVLSVLKNFIPKNKTKHLDGSFLYPIGGFGEIFTSILDIIDNNSIFFNSSATNLVHDGCNIKNIVFSDGKQINVSKSDRVISSLPMPLLIKGLYPRVPEELINFIDSLKYRSLKLVVLFLNKDSFTNNASIYFPQPDIPFTRIYEPKNRSKHMAPNGKTCIVIEIPYDTNNPSMAARYSAKAIISLLSDRKLISKGDVFDSKIIDVPYAYPVVTSRVRSNLDKVYELTNKFQNLQLIGRSADFKYLHVHDLFDSAKSIISKIQKTKAIL